MFGGGVAEADVLSDIVGGQRHLAVISVMGHRDGPVHIEFGDGPGVAVADRLAGRGDETAVVAAGGDDVTDVGVLAAGDLEGLRVEVAGVVSGCLNNMVDAVDVVVGRGDQGDALAVLVVVDPGGGDAGEVVVEAPGHDPAPSLVGVQGAGHRHAAAVRRWLPSVG